MHPSVKRLKFYGKIRSTLNPLLNKVNLRLEFNMILGTPGEVGWDVVGLSLHKKQY